MGFYFSNITQTMKKYLFTAAIAFATVTGYAQQDANTAADALRYSIDNLTGTARFRAMSGAFGAVGGDVSAIGVNPAGAAIFNFNSGTASLSSYNVNNKASFFGNTQKKNDNSFDLNQLGAVFVFNNSKEDAVMNRFTLGFNYENTNSFENNIYTAGINPTGTIGNYFLRYANGIGNEGGITLGTLRNANFENLSYIDQQAYLGYNAYAFNPVANSNDNTVYTSNIPATNNHYQDSYQSSTGYNGKVALNFAVQLVKKLYLGANVNIHFADYINNTSFFENMNNSGSGLQSIQFDTKKYTYGGGASFNLGAIYQATTNLRAGLAYESPTWLSLQDEITQRVIAVNGGSTIVTDPNLTMVSDNYTLKTPSKYTGSLAYVFGRSGLISVDYALRDYSNTKYTNSRYAGVNNEMASTLNWAGELRVGAEYRIKKLSLRGGYRYQQSPYSTGNKVIGDSYGFSGGLGFNFGGSRLDLAYSWFQRKANLGLVNSNYVDAARVTTTNNNVTLSYTIDL